MGIEGPRPQEVIGRGQLYLLAQPGSLPGSEFVSGYGLTTHTRRKDRLVGLWRVDHPANPLDTSPADWLAQIEELYGECQLAPMTSDGAFGLVTHLRIARDSLPLVQRAVYPQAIPQVRGLQSLLDPLPAPVLQVSWDNTRQRWCSEFWIGLPPVLQEVFDQVGAGCLAVEREDRSVAFVTHAPDADLPRLQGAPVFWRWRLEELPTAPLIRFEAVILDDPTHAFDLEHFLNVADRAQARCLARLLNQEEIVFDFYGSDYQYAGSQQIAHPEAMRQELQAIVRRAVEHYGRIPPGQRNFDRAKAEFTRRFSA